MYDDASYCGPRLFFSLVHESCLQNLGELERPKLQDAVKVPIFIHTTPVDIKQFTLMCCLCVCPYIIYVKYMYRETHYGLDGPGSNPGGDEIFRPSRPGLGPTQPSVQWVPGLCRV